MDPSEIEFLAEIETVEIVPNFAHEKLDLISGSVGPFRPDIPICVPIWLAVNLKSRQKCRIVPPAWMDLEELQALLRQETELPHFCKPPSEHYMVEAKILLRIADGDIPRAEALRTVIKDIWDKRQAKLRTSINEFINFGGSSATLTHLTAMELSAVRPLFPHSLNFLNKLRAKRVRNTEQSSSDSGISSNSM